MDTRSLLFAAATVLVASPAFAGPPNTGGEPLYDTVNLSGGFTPDPSDVAVRAGGDEDASAMGLGDGCVGNILTGQPDVRLQFAPGSAPLSIASCADSDTTLIVNDPSGAWHCDDDTEGTNPVVQFGSPAGGTYDIWVGTYSEGPSAAATVRISERGGAICAQPGAASAAASTAPGGGGTTLGYGGEPRYGQVTLEAGFSPDPHRVDVVAGGSTDVDDVGNIPADCAGHIAADAPDFRVDFLPGASPLRFASCAGADTTLIINDAAGNWHCDDDTEGSNPVVTIATPPAGQYDVWVGTYSTETTDANLRISERSGTLCD